MIGIAEWIHRNRCRQMQECTGSQVSTAGCRDRTMVPIPTSPPPPPSPTQDKFRLPAVDSFIRRRQLRPAITVASRSARRWASVKYEGTFTEDMVVVVAQILRKAQSKMFTYRDDTIINSFAQICLRYLLQVG